MAVIPTRDFSEGKYLVFGTRKGMVKKTEFKDYDTNIKAAGLIAINIKKGDDLIEVRQTSGKDDIIMVSKSGKATRFNEKLARPMGRGTAGVKGMNVSQKGNEVLSLEVASDQDELFVVTENGYGKRSPMSEYPVKGRGTQGVLTIKLTEKKGGLAGAMIVRDHQELIFISQNGMVQRNSVDGISIMGRSTQGVRVMNLKKGDRVSAVALVVENGNGDTGAKVERATTKRRAWPKRRRPPRRLRPRRSRSRRSRRGRRLRRTEGCRQAKGRCEGQRPRRSRLPRCRRSRPRRRRSLQASGCRQA